MLLLLQHFGKYVLRQPHPLRLCRATFPRGEGFPDTKCLHHFHKMDLHFLCRWCIIALLALKGLEC